MKFVLGERASSSCVNYIIKINPGLFPRFYLPDTTHQHQQTTLEREFSDGRDVKE